MQFIKHKRDSVYPLPSFPQWRPCKTIAFDNPDAGSDTMCTSYTGFPGYLVPLLMSSCVRVFSSM